MTRGEDYGDYYCTKTLDSGQMIRVDFFQYEYNTICYYFFALAIANKRKNLKNVTGLITGKDGLKGLIFTKEKIIEFEEFIKEEAIYIGIKTPIKIVIQWDDNRRRNVYERGLKGLGYKYDKTIFGKCLSKKFDIINKY